MNAHEMLDRISECCRNQGNIMNAREMLAHISEWLSYQDETLSFGLHNAFDALRLYDYSLEHSELSEMADDWDPQDRIAALGYDR